MLAIKEYHEWKNVFWTSIALNLLAYLGFIVHFTYAVDDYGYFFSEVNHIAHGRWLAGFIYNILLQKSLLPTLSPIIAILFFVLTGIGLCKLWNVNQKTSLPVVLLWSLHPYLLDTYNFKIATVNCAVTYLIATAALFFATKGKRDFIFSIGLLYLALSIYQVAMGFVIAVVMMQVLLMCFRENFSAASIREGGKLFLRYMILFAVSVAVYLVITKLIFMFSDVEVNSRLEAGFISNMEQFKAKLCVVATVLFVRLGPIKEFILPFTGKLAIFAVYLCAILTLMKRTHKLNVIGAVLVWLALIPLGAISFSLPLEDLSLPWRVCMGLVVFFAGMAALTQESDSLLIRQTGLALSSFLIICFIFNNNTILYKQHLTNQNDFIMGNRIIAKIQSLDGYQPGMALAIVGRIQKENFSKEGKGNSEIVRDYIKHSSVRRYSLARSAFETDWSKYSFLLNYMNLELKPCDSEKLDQVRRLCTDRNPWPDPSSVFIENKTVVLILSQSDESI